MFLKKYKHVNFSYRLIMKVNIFLLFILLLCGFRSYTQVPSHAQKISVKFENVKFDIALNQIANTYNIPIAFNATEAHSVKVTANFESMPVEQVLTHLAQSVNMEVAKVNDVFIIKPSSSAIKPKMIDISVKIEDKYSEEPLPYALISIKHSSLFATSNRQGIFNFINISDTSQVQISYLGYKDTLISVQNLTSSLQLRPDPNLLKEVVINDQGSNTIQYGEEISKISFNPSSIDRLPVLGGNDAFRALQLLPGVSGTNETSAGLIIRGSSPDKNLVLLDGYSLYHVDHFYGIYSAFNSKAIKNVQLYKGNFSAKYGGRSSGVLVLTAKDGNRTKFSADLGINFIDANGLLEFVLSDKLTLVIAGRRSISDVVENYLFRELFDKAVINSGDINNASSLNHEEINPNFTFGDLNVKLSYKPSVKDNFALSFYASNDNLNYEYTSTIEDLVEYTTAERSLWGNVGASGTWSRQWNKKLSTQAQIAFSSYYSNTRFEKLYVFDDTLGIDNEKYLQAQNNNVYDFTAQIDNQFRTSKNSVLNFGIANTFNIINLSSIIDEEPFPILEQTGNQLQFYGEYQIFITPKLETKLGLRGNYYNVTDILYWEPKVNLTYSALPWLSLKGSWGINNQMISRILRLDLFTSNPDFWLLSDNDIPVINSNHWAAGVHLNLPFATIDIEGYVSKTFDEVEYLPSLRNFDEDQVHQGQLYAIGRTVTKGIEVLIEKGVGNYSGWVGYTLSSGLNYFEGLNGGNPFPSRFDQRHELKLVNMYDAGAWNFSLIWIYGSGNPYSSPEGTYTLSTIDGSTISNIAYSRINNNRLPAYHRLDFSSTYNFNLGNTEAKIGLSVFNLYNKKNVKYRRFSKITFDENGQLLDSDKYIISDILLLGLTPSLFLNWKF